MWLPRISKGVPKIVIGGTTVHLWPKYRHIGIADGMSAARVWPYPRNRHAVGDADIEPIYGMGVPKIVISAWGHDHLGHGGMGP